MNVLVSDTSVLIDLERGQLLEPCFRLPYEFAVPDLLYKRELAEFGGPALVAQGLRIEELTGAELASVQVVRRENSGLSVPDAYALTLADARGWTLLTGDGLLRNLAEASSIPFHGVLWVLDEIFRASAIEPDSLLTALQAIADHPRCRLPRAEINMRLAKYRE